MRDDAEKQQNTRRISSPEQLDDYLKVTSPKIWVLLVAIILLVGGLLVWSTFTTVESYATGKAYATGGELSITFDDQTKASRVQPGMELNVGDVETEVLTVGVDENGEIVASAQAHIPDGLYTVRVGYKATQVISMLLN